MVGVRDDFLDALNYRVKEEVVNNYLRERLILEEEYTEYQEELARYRTLEAGAREARDMLACLLVSRGNLEEFFRLLGFDKPPFSRWDRGELAERQPFCPWGLTPWGLTRRRRYVNLIMHVYGRLQSKAAEGGREAERLGDLAREINEDVSRFHRNFDVMAIVHFLKSMDTTMRMKKHFMGENFSADEVGALEETMTLKKLDPQADGVRPWPDIPPIRQARQRVEDFLGRVFRREREAIQPALAKAPS
ncbi:MAG: hypothetical protein KKB20_19715 [Proteobacteria bacterium]|nr:hypothetical protein [Pseudomonadota bacterium]